MLIQMFLTSWQDEFRKCYIQAAFERGYSVTNNGVIYWVHVEDIDKFLGIVWYALHLLSKIEVPSVICQRRHFTVADYGRRFWFEFEYGCGMHYGCV